MSDWQTIETGPKDGTRVLLLLPTFREGYRVQIGYYAHTKSFTNDKLTYESAEWHVEGHSAFLGGPPKPSHWMPLPDELVVPPVISATEIMNRERERADER